jgi:hypothetical protein
MKFSDCFETLTQGTPEKPKSSANTFLAAEAIKPFSLPKTEKPNKLWRLSLARRTSLV